MANKKVEVASTNLPDVQQLTREGKLTNEQFDKMDRQAKETALASVRFAEESPEPPLEKLYAYSDLNGAVG